jgi:hypothetical protein
MNNKISEKKIDELVEYYKQKGIENIHIKDGTRVISEVTAILLQELSFLRKQLEWREYPSQLPAEEGWYIGEVDWRGSDHPSIMQSYYKDGQWGCEPDGIVWRWCFATSLFEGNM